VGEFFGYVEYAMIVLGQIYRQPPGKCWRIGAEINDDIIDCSSGAAHDFGFLMGGYLVMHAAQSAAFVIERDAALDKSGVQAVIGKLSLAPDSSEKTPLVFIALRLNDERPFELGLGEDHTSEPSAVSGEIVTAKSMDFCQVIRCPWGFLLFAAFCSRLTAPLPLGWEQRTVRPTLGRSSSVR
jgi:hypothetical protein